MTQQETSLLLNLGAELERLVRVARALEGRRGRGPRWRHYLGRELGLFLEAALRRLSAEIKTQIEPRKPRRPKKGRRR